ncbi:hypothetical protein O7614_25300 [Micromonospora sp. WMMD961]|uniref:hypothetical protein n=1 Tax=Micromonospora sp. WMMD961 TaxID=3016100 RepID=UPI0024166ED2|nr:hypothetical protein [Micromonospora sp. WMMD961]MDG4782986.1 hypothetical protein [Micromonospora sp. WMMD961]
MAIDTTGTFWRGDNFTDLADYLREYQPGGYPVARVREMICQRCGDKSFAVLADDENGCAQTRCLTCGDHALIADSADYWQDADPEECACPCGGEAFQVAVGFALRTDGEVRWVSVGLRCTEDGTLGVYTDWKIDYSPTGHLLIDAA